MSRPKIDFHREAILEAKEARAHLVAEDPQLGPAFDADIENAIDRALAFPLARPRVIDDIRSVLLRRFRYRILYRPTLAGVYIIAIAHTSRDPDYWRDRDA